MTRRPDDCGEEQTDASVSRRAFAVGVTGTAAAVAGCGELLSGEKDIRYRLATLDGSAYEVDLSVLAADDDRIELRWTDREPWQRGLTDGSLDDAGLDETTTLRGIEPLGEPLATATVSVQDETETGTFESVPRSAGLLAVGRNTETGRTFGLGSWGCPSGTIRELTVEFTRDRVASLGTACVS